MKYFAFLILLGSLLSWGKADGLPAIDPGKLYAALSHDWDEDGIRDHALLIDGVNGDSDLVLVMSRADGLVLREFAIAGGMMTRPWLEVNEAGSLVVIQGNDAVGRNRWESRTTIAFRDGRFVVAGYDYVARDTLDLDFNLDYSANYLTGKIVRNGSVKKVDASAIPVEKWEPPTDL